MHLIKGANRHRPCPCGQGPPASVLMTGAQKLMRPRPRQVVGLTACRSTQPPEHEHLSLKHDRDVHHSIKGLNLWRFTQTRHWHTFEQERPPKKINWTEDVNHRAIATSITVNKQPVTSMRWTYFTHPGVRRSSTRKKLTVQSRKSRNPRKLHNWWMPTSTLSMDRDWY